MQTRTVEDVVVLDLGNVKVPSGQTSTFAKTVEESFFANKIVFDGTFNAKGIHFNLYVDRGDTSKSFPIWSSLDLQVGDVFRVEIINQSEEIFATSIRLFGRPKCS